eukprot:TRINITY_DN2174_c0_g2_i1.p1 TRINITY_DN2174_c0_g2~~TRINITY_DN2174_c0_g2_i1.p1  ORF type:complete len:1627 (+),score=401.60 TRINITY_DN2174_c0_g2_i1:65-4945(+)
MSWDPPRPRRSPEVASGAGVGLLLPPKAAPQQSYGPAARRPLAADAADSAPRRRQRVDAPPAAPPQQPHQQPSMTDARADLFDPAAVLPSELAARWCPTSTAEPTANWAPPPGAGEGPGGSVPPTTEALQPAPPQQGLPPPQRRPSAPALRQQGELALLPGGGSGGADAAARRRQQQLEYKRDLDAQIAARRRASEDAAPQRGRVTPRGAAGGVLPAEAVDAAAERVRRQEEYRRELDRQLREREQQHRPLQADCAAPDPPAGPQRRGSPADAAPPLPGGGGGGPSKAERQAAYRRELDAQRAEQERLRAQKQEQQPRRGSAAGPRREDRPADGGHALQQPPPRAAQLAGALPPDGQPADWQQPGDWQQHPAAHAAAAVLQPPAAAPLAEQYAQLWPPQQRPQRPAEAQPPWQARAPASDPAPLADPGAPLVGALPRVVEGRNSPASAEARWVQQQSYAAALQQQQDEQRRVRQGELDRQRERLPTPRQTGSAGGEGRPVPPALRDTLHETDAERRDMQRRKQDEYRRQLDEHMAARRQQQQQQTGNQGGGSRPQAPPPETPDSAQPVQQQPPFARGRGRFGDQRDAAEEERKREAERKWKEELDQQIAAKAERAAREQREREQRDAALEQRFQQQLQEEAQAAAAAAAPRPAPPAAAPPPPGAAPDEGGAPAEGAAQSESGAETPAWLKRPAPAPRQLQQQQHEAVVWAGADAPGGAAWGPPAGREAAAPRQLPEPHPQLPEPHPQLPEPHPQLPEPLSATLLEEQLQDGGACRTPQDGLHERSPQPAAARAPSRGEGCSPPAASDPARTCPDCGQPLATAGRFCKWSGAEHARLKQQFRKRAAPGDASPAPAAAHGPFAAPPPPYTPPVPPPGQSAAEAASRAAADVVQAGRRGSRDADAVLAAYAQQLPQPPAPQPGPEDAVVQEGTERGRVCNLLSHSDLGVSRSMGTKEVSLTAETTFVYQQQAGLAACAAVAPPGSTVSLMQSLQSAPPSSASCPENTHEAADPPPCQEEGVAAGEAPPSRWQHPGAVEYCAVVGSVAGDTTQSAYTDDCAAECSSAGERRGAELHTSVERSPPHSECSPRLQAAGAAGGEVAVSPSCGSQRAAGSPCSGSGGSCAAADAEDDGAAAPLDGGPTSGAGPPPAALGSGDRQSRPLPTPAPPPARGSEHSPPAPPRSATPRQPAAGAAPCGAEEDDEDEPPAAELALRISEIGPDEAASVVTVPSLPELLFGTQGADSWAAQQTRPGTQSTVRPGTQASTRYAPTPRLPGRPAGAGAGVSHFGRCEDSDSDSDCTVDPRLEVSRAMDEDSGGRLASAATADQMSAGRGGFQRNQGLPPAGCPASPPATRPAQPRTVGALGQSSEAWVAAAQPLFRASLQVDAGAHGAAPAAAARRGSYPQSSAESASLSAAADGGPARHPVIRRSGELVSVRGSAGAGSLTGAPLRSSREQVPPLAERRSRTDLRLAPLPLALRRPVSPPRLASPPARVLQDRADAFGRPYSAPIRGSLPALSGLSESAQGALAGGPPPVERPKTLKDALSVDPPQHGSVRLSASAGSSSSPYAGRTPLRLGQSSIRRSASAGSATLSLRGYASGGGRALQRTPHSTDAEKAKPAAPGKPSG